MSAFDVKVDESSRLGFGSIDEFRAYVQLWMQLTPNLNPTEGLRTLRASYDLVPTCLSWDRDTLERQAHEFAAWGVMGGARAHAPTWARFKTHHSRRRYGQRSDVGRDRL